MPETFSMIKRIVKIPMPVEYRIVCTYSNLDDFVPVAIVIPTPMNLA